MIAKKYEPSLFVYAFPMRSVGNVVTFDHQIVRKSPAIIANAPCFDGFEKIFTVLILLEKELAVVVKLV